MMKVARKSSDLIFLIGLCAIFSGCTYTLKDCREYAGTGGYDLCRAEQGDEQAQYEVGLNAYKKGDMGEAIKWLERAAEPKSGHFAAYLPPVGGQKYGTVLPYDKEKSSDGNRAAQLLLTKIYQNGLGVEKDLGKAEKYKILAEKNRE